MSDDIKTTAEKLKEVEKFIKDAFIIDGEVTTVFEPTEYESHFRCVDSKRGVILVSFKPEK